MTTGTLAPTFVAAFQETVARNADRIAVKTHDGSIELTWKQLSDRVDAVARGLAELGVKRGDTVAMLLANRPEFHVIDLAILTLGATPFSIYTTSSAEQIEYVVGDAGATVALVQESLKDNFVEARKNLPKLEHLVVLDADTAPEGTVRFEDVENSDFDIDLDAARAAVEPDDILTLIYTSGTTGPPKGVELTHKNLIIVAQAAHDIVKLQPGDRVISWLPAAHIAERGAHHYAPIAYGLEITTSPDPRGVVGLLPQVRPQWFFAVPRIWEKLKSGLETMLASQPEEQRKPLEDALAASIERIRLQQKGEPVPAELEEQFKAADEQYFSGLRTMLGLDQLRAVNVGAAPTPVEVLEFFHAIGIELSELWGMSETAAVATLNAPGEVKIGTVGKAIPGVEIKLAEDNEILVRGDTIMRGYRNQPEKTAETIDPETGWLSTGDIGSIDDDGYLKIVDRKKELIINAAGKNMSPANIEAALKVASPLIGHVAAIGDSRPYNTALIVLDADFAPVWAQQHGIEDTALESLAKNDEVRAAVQEGVDSANSRLSRVEQIKKFHLIGGDWVPGGEELTPTMKLKRKPIAAKYEAEIEALYR